MKILYVHDYEEATGGAELLVYRLRDGMRRLGHDARLFASSAGDTNKSDQQAEYRCFGTKSSMRGLVQTFNPMAAFSLRRAIAEFRPDVIHVAMFLTQLSPSILPLLRNIPSLYHAMWYRAICPNGTKLLPTGQQCTKNAGRACLAASCVSKLDWLPLMLQMSLTRQWIDAFDTILPVSLSVRHQLRDAGIPCQEVIPLGLEEHPRSDATTEPMLIGFAGRLVREKGVDILLRAFARALVAIPQARLLVIGDGPQREPLANLAAELRVSNAVEFAGHLPRSQVEQRLAPAMAQVVCSQWAEPFGLVAVEAMFRRTAVIASETGGLKDIVRHEQTGLLVSPGDAGALSVAIIRLLTNPLEARSMGERGLQRACEEYSEPVMLARMQSLYTNLIQARAHRALAVPANLSPQEAT